MQDHHVEPITEHAIQNGGQQGRGPAGLNDMACGQLVGPRAHDPPNCGDGKSPLDGLISIGARQPPRLTLVGMQRLMIDSTGVREILPDQLVQKTATGAPWIHHQSKIRHLAPLL